MEISEFRSSCPINYLLELVGDKWSLLIIRDIIFDDKYSYSDFLNSEEKIATNILANRLSKLEDEGFLQKSPGTTSKVRYTYTLTPMAIDLIPMFVEMILWSAKHAPAQVPPDREEDLRKAKADRVAYIKEIRERVEARSSALHASTKMS